MYTSPMDLNQTPYETQTYRDRSHRCSLTKPLNSKQARNASSKFQSRKKKDPKKKLGHILKDSIKSKRKKKENIQKQSWPGQQKFPTWTIFCWLNETEEDTHRRDSSEMKCFQSHLCSRLSNTLSAQGSYCCTGLYLCSGVFFFAKIQEVPQLRQSAAIHPWKN